MKNYIFLFILFLYSFYFSSTIKAQKYFGGDASMLPTYEKQGNIYYTEKGKAMPFLDMVKESGWNTIRVRLFVEPQYAPQAHQDEGVIQDLAYIIPFCQQIQDKGMDIMLDFHYSDTWADPGKQFIPQSWLKASKDALADSVYNYTKRSLITLKNNGITPKFIQVGNEITFGMLWPAGKVNPLENDNWDYLTQYIRSGSKACREICPQSKIIIHTEHAQQLKTTLSYYNHLKEYGVDYDIIGLSYYPMWHGSIPHLRRVLNALSDQYPDKKIMITETAFYYSHQKDQWAKSANQYGQYYSITPKGQAKFTRKLITMLNKQHNVIGVFWWFPEENESKYPVLKGWINRGLFDNNNGKALPAFYEFIKYKKNLP